MEPDKITLSQQLRGRQGLAAKVESQSSLVAEEIGLSTATADWDFQQDERGRDLLVLHVRDALGAEAQSRFAPLELDNEPHLRQRLHELLGAALRINQWRMRIGSLYSRVEEWVRGQDPTAILEEQPTTLNEEKSGPYEVPVLSIDSRGRSARLEPVASWVVTADGRVDMIGIGGIEVLVLEEGRGWFWVSDQRRDPLQPLTETLFLQLLDTVGQ